MEKVFITGIGLITPLGFDVTQNRKSLIDGKCGIGKLEHVSTKYADIRPFGEVKLTNTQLKDLLKVNDNDVSRTSLLALHALNQALVDAHISSEEISSHNTALVVGTTVGGMCLTDELYNDANAKHNGTQYLSSYDGASVAIFLQKRHAIGGIVNTINTACSSSANAIMYGARLIKNGLAKRAIVGGVDSLAKFTINGFNALHILSPNICTPFDANRSGLNLGEGAAFLILEGEESCRDKETYAQVLGYSNTNDAFHPSTLSETGDGPYLAMSQALKEAKLNSSEIDYINAHGTGTENNDEVESVAMIKLFEGKVPAFSSTKSNIGHTLGASGAIEAVHCLLMLKHQEVYQSLNFKEAIPSTKLIPQLAYSQLKIKHAMSNSFGFGGNCSSLIFSKN